MKNDSKKVAMLKRKLEEMKKDLKHDAKWDSESFFETSKKSYIGPKIPIAFCKKDRTRVFFDLLLKNFAWLSTDVSSSFEFIQA